jgi:2-polyprenyl-6-methoxyphenol hydroxylase-like FAD-dependent oxidoreductase
MRVLVVGAGIAGQTLACALARRDIACDLIELRREFDIIGAGMYMQANALRAFEDIGVVAAIHAAGYPIWADHTVITDVNGEVLARMLHRHAPGEERKPIMVPIQRRALHDVLAHAVARAGIVPKMGVTVDSIEGLDTPEHPLDVTLTDGTRAHYDLVVGADGIHSKIRDLVFPGTRPEYSGFANWRVLLPRPPEVTTPRWMMGAEGKSFGMVPLSADMLYIAGVSKEPGNPRFERDDLARLCRERFTQFDGLGGELLKQVTRGEQVVYTAIEQVELPAPWHRGRVVVLGDAAHASTPFWAQGAAMAIEDVVVLARMLGDSGSIPATLSHWMTRRYDRCRYVQSGSLETGRRGHSEEPGSLEARYAYLRSGGAQADLDRRLARLAEPI